MPTIDYDERMKLTIAFLQILPERSLKENMKKGIRACRDDEVLILHALAVHPDFQGCGIGKMILKCIFDLAQGSRERK